MRNSALLLYASLFLPTLLHADTVAVRRSQGTAHAFLTLHSLVGAPLAAGELIQVAHGDRVTSRLVFRFRDGSIDDETSVFTQRGSFHLISDHHLQRGPSFPKPMDFFLDERGQVTIRNLADLDSAGKPKVDGSHIDLPPDTANGLISAILTNIPAGTLETRVAMVLPAGKGRLAHLLIKPDGQEAFTASGAHHAATIYRVHFELGGIVGVVAPVVGKQPEDIRAWVMGGDAPTLLKLEAQLYEGGPIWRMEMTAPAWPGSR